jgi:hypothetical protein
MDVPAEWRSLAERFAALGQRAPRLSATWFPPGWRITGEPWILQDPDDDWRHDHEKGRVYSDFAALAQRGAVLLGQQAGPEASF